MISEWVYRALLVPYPSEHRREYEEQMVQLFGDRMRRDGGGYRSAIVWLHILSDLFHSALNEHLERVGLWGVIKALLYPTFLSKYSPQTARTKSEVAITTAGALPYTNNVLRRGNNRLFCLLTQRAIP